jgi:hypothetical protein
MRPGSRVPLSWPARTPWVAKCRHTIAREIATRGEALDLGFGGTFADADVARVGAEAARYRAQLVRRLGQRCLTPEVREVGHASDLRDGRKRNQRERHWPSGTVLTISLMQQSSSGIGG